MIPNGLASESIPPRTVHHNVFARLQSFFPSSAGSNSHSSNHGQDESNENSPTSPISPKFLKVRILTWNMHDSVPKGDLEEILGSVPPYATPESSLESFPILQCEPSHPYHLVVIASQECPSLSGIPMGLGAGFKLVDKEKDREKEKDADNGKDNDMEILGEGDTDHDRPRFRAKDKAKVEGHHRLKSSENLLHESNTSGWTSVVEDWLCHGSSCVNSPATNTPTSSYTSQSKESHAQTRSRGQQKGPYHLLIKERMMGIYLAVYIHRDIKCLVRGTSKSAVTAGLIGGRVGNKGGIGISLNLAGITFLFINAHLAAHEDKVNLRLANLAKIKTELAVDNFLKSNDPRVMSEDLTDMFDYTFVCGDLNFRLDISRLHADWLIARQDYAQALAFDQLRSLMQSGDVFVGFQEAAINFPPTFKYDVMRTSKKSKKRGSKLHNWKQSAEKLNHLLEEAKKMVEDVEEEDNDEEEEGAEDASMASSAWTSIQSRPATDTKNENSNDATPLPTTNTPGRRLSTAQKAKGKWLALLSPPLSSHPGPRRCAPEVCVAAATPEAPSSPVAKASQFYFGPHPTSSHHIHNPFLHPPLVHANSSTSSGQSEEEEGGFDKGVYDSSHKKRVPSWCDRILWKSTVHAELVSEEQPEDISPRPLARMGQFIRNTFFSARGHTESQDSMNSSEKQGLDADIPTTSSPTSELTDHGCIAAPDITFKRSLTSPPVSSQEPIITTPKLPIRRSFTAPSSATTPRAESLSSPQLPNRGYSSMPTSTSTTAEDTPHVPDANQDPRSVLTPAVNRWRIFTMLSRDSTSRANQDRFKPQNMPQGTVPRKGDVICLDYNTLDDRGMRRLEGRSDHRPVIGSYAVYI